MPNRVCIRGFLGVLGFVLLSSQPAVAQEGDPLRSVAAADAEVAAPVVDVTFREKVAEWRSAFATWRVDAGVMFPLYAGFSGLQVLDIHSTTRAIDRGAVETNGVLSGVAGTPMALTVAKTATTAATIYLLERNVRKQHRTLAIATMIGTNALCAIVVAHNYRVAARG